VTVDMDEGLSVKSRSIVSAVLLGVIGLVVVAGCGGGGSSSPSDSSSGADAACATANRQIAALGTPRQKEIRGYLEKTEDVIKTLHREVAALGGSGAAEAAYTKALGKAVIVLNRMSNAARNKNFDAVGELSRHLMRLHLGELAEAAGLTVCAEVLGAKNS
jgi:hypothetical protein